MSDLLNKASLVVIPSGYKEDTVYSVVPSDGSGDLSFTRASNGTRINSAGLVEVCPWNLLQYSEQFTNAIWTPKSGTFTDNFAVAPNGTTTAAKWQATDSDPYIYQGFTGVNQDYTATCWVKATGTAIGKNCSIRIGGDAVFTAMTGEWQLLTITANINGSENVGVEAPESATSGEIVYIWGFQLNIGSTAKPYFPTTDRLNVPRLTYQNGGGGCPSLLLEKQSTNISNYNESSSAFNAAIVTSASGLLGMKSYNVEADYSLGDAPNVPCSDFIANTTYTSSMYVDFNSLTGTQFIVTMLGFFPSVEFATMTVNKSTKAITSSTTGGGIWTINAAKIEHQKDEIYRVILTATPNTTGGGARTYVDSGNFESVNVAGIQVEASSYATSVILKTTSSSATRVADVCVKTGIGSLIGQNEGVVFIDCVLNGTSTGGASNYGNIINTNRTANTTAAIAITYYESTNTLTASYFNGDGSYIPIVTMDKASINIGDRIKVALAYKSGDFALYVNGVLGATRTTTFTPAGGMTDIYIDDVNIYYGYPMGLKVNEVVLIKTRVSNAELISLTTL